MRTMTTHNGTVGKIRLRRLGVSIAEVMISLAIAATLLTATAMAYQASMRAVDMNDQFFRASQAARVSVNQIMTEVRRCATWHVDDANTDQVQIQTAPMASRPSEVWVYTFDRVNHQLLVSIQSINPVPVMPIARNVEDVKFTKDAAGTTVCMLMKVKVGDNEVVVSGSASPRKAVTYSY